MHFDTGYIQKEIAELKDEIRRLKGEQGKPNIRPGKKIEIGLISSESERMNQDSVRKTSRRKRHLEFHEEQKYEIDKSTLPADAESKGYTKKIYQGIKVQLHNILILRNHRPRIFRLNDEAFSLMSKMKINQSYIEQIKGFKSDNSLNELELLSFAFRFQVRTFFRIC